MQPGIHHWSIYPKYFKENIINIEKDICLKKVSPEKPIIVFHEMKSIRNYIVTTDIKKSHDQKKAKITTQCYSRRKTCHLIRSDETLRNILNGKEIKKLHWGSYRTANIVYGARCKIQGDIYIANTGQELRERERGRERDSATTGTMPKPD